MDVTKSERFEQLDRLLTEHDGMLQTAQVIASGIVKPIFYEYVKEKNLQQVAHGIYVSEDTWIDAMFLLHLRCGQAVFSHESALFFHDLTDREPSPYAITVRRGYSTTRLKAEGLSVYTIKPELYEVGLTTGQTPFGHTVPVYDGAHHLRSAPQPKQHGNTDFSRCAEDVCQKKGQGSADFDAVCRYVPG